MNRKFALVTGIVGFSLLITQCGKKQLDRDQAMHLLQKENVYPKIVDYRVFCGHTETAKKMIDTGLDQQGLVRVQLNHTLADVGKPLVIFTEKAQRYLLPTSDTARSLDVQIVKLADEELLEITDIQIDATGEKAIIGFVTSMENLTPFVALLQSPMEKKQARQTQFTLTEDGWHWDGKIIKTQLR
jgi:hypothetical protein